MAGSNPAESMDFRRLRLLVGTEIYDELSLGHIPTARARVCVCVCVCVIYKPHQHGGQDPSWAVAHPPPPKVSMPRIYSL
jgi:hypothetical protein